MSSLALDLRQVLRALARSPGYAVTVICILALGLGVNLALGTLLYSQVMRPFDGPDPERLMAVHMHRGAPSRGPLSPHHFLTLQRESRTLTSLCATSSRLSILDQGDGVSRVGVIRVSAATLPLLGLPAYFRAEEDLAGQPPRVLVSSGFAQGQGPSLVGHTLRLDGLDHQIVGVLPPDFRFPDAIGSAPFLVPLALTPSEIQSRTSSFLALLGRLAPGVSAAAAQDEVGGIVQRLETELRGPSHKNRAVVVSQLEAQNPDWMRIVGLNLACGMTLLLIGCANVANLALTRWLPRGRELGLRSALGASRLNALRPLILESVLLAAAGGSLAVLMQGPGLVVVERALYLNLPRSAPPVPAPLRLFLFLGLLLMTVLLLVVPMVWALGRLDPARALKEQGRGTGTPGHGNLRSALVVAQVALASTLLATALLLVRSLESISNVPVGFDATNVLMASLQVPTTYGPKALDALQDDLLRGAGSLTGVRTAALVDRPPMVNSSRVSGYAYVGGDSQEHTGNAELRAVLGDYFQTLGIHLVAGRAMAPAESDTCVVNERLARAAWFGLDPLGRSIRAGGSFRVVGVVRDTRNASLLAPMGEQIYLPLPATSPAAFSLLLKTEGNPALLIPAVAGLVRGLDRNIPLDDLQPITRLFTGQVSKERALSRLFSTLAGIALALAVLGLASALSLAVTQRRPEIGLRMALGANLDQVLRLILGQGLRQVLLGLALGLPTAYAMAGLLRNRLHGVVPGDPRATVAAALMLGLSGLLACLIPALRAARANPAEALRAE
jgi:putative ABC transport system permease protein